MDTDLIFHKIYLLSSLNVHPELPSVNFSKNHNYLSLGKQKITIMAMSAVGDPRSNETPRTWQKALKEQEWLKLRCQHNRDGRARDFAKACTPTHRLKYDDSVLHPANIMLADSSACHGNPQHAFVSIGTNRIFNITMKGLCLSL